MNGSEYLGFTLSPEAEMKVELRYRLGHGVNREGISYLKRGRDLSLNEC